MNVIKDKSGFELGSGVNYETLIYNTLSAYGVKRLNTSILLDNYRVVEILGLYEGDKDLTNIGNYLDDFGLEVKEVFDNQSINFDQYLRNNISKIKKGSLHFGFLFDNLKVTKIVFCIKTDKFDGSRDKLDSLKKELFNDIEGLLNI